MLKNKPNFLIVGAAKSGTTSLYHYLSQHPDIYMSSPNKEPKYFVHDKFTDLVTDNPQHDEFIQRSTVRNKDEYYRLFDEAENIKAIGEGSVMYLYYYKTAIPKIKTELGDIKIIIMLRNPIESIYSAYTHLVRDNSELYSFEEALDMEKERKEKNYAPLYLYKDLALYYNQVKAYKENFTNVKVLLFDDMKTSNKQLVEETLNFLNVDINYIPKNINKVYNSSGIPKNKILHSIISKPNSIRNVFKRIIPKKYRLYLVESIRGVNLKKIPMKQETQHLLVDYFKEDILKLENLINRDLSHWLKKREK